MPESWGSQASKSLAKILNDVMEKNTNMYMFYFILHFPSKVHVDFYLKIVHK